jgi:hypothetical protein
MIISFQQYFALKQSKTYVTIIDNNSINRKKNKRKNIDFLALLM